MYLPGSSGIDKEAGNDTRRVQREDKRRGVYQDAEVGIRL